MKAQLKVIVITAIIITIVLLYPVYGNERNDIELLANAFTSTEADLESYSFQFSKYYSYYTNDEQLLMDGNKISSMMEIPETSNLDLEDGQRIYVSNGIWDTGSQVQIQIKRKDNQSQEQYLIFKVTGSSSLDDLKEDYYHITKNLQDNLRNIKINSCIQGNIYVNLNNTRQYVLIEEILKKIDAERVESFDSDLVNSISAYTPNIDNYILTGNKKMNFQVSTHYDKIHQKTVLTMGTPIINIEY